MSKKGIKRPLSEVMVENSDYARGALKRRLLKEKILQNVCSECGQGPIWNNKPLVLHLDHKNGIKNDHRLENLCILCPHCHSQTTTFAGRNTKRTKQIKVLKGRHKEILCTRRVVRPSKDELYKLLWEKPCTHIGKELGVSDSAIKKWARSYGIEKPPRGYWSKKR